MRRERPVEHDRLRQQAIGQGLVNGRARIGARIDADVTARAPKQGNRVSVPGLSQQRAGILAPEAAGQGDATHLNAGRAGDRLHRVPSRIHLDRCLNDDSRCRPHVTRRVKERVARPRYLFCRALREQVREPEGHALGGFPVLAIRLEKALPPRVLLALVPLGQHMEEPRMQDRQRQGHVLGRVARRQVDLPRGLRQGVTRHDLLDARDPAGEALGRHGRANGLRQRKRHQPARLHRNGHQTGFRVGHGPQKQAPGRDLEEEPASATRARDREDGDPSP